MKEEIRIHLEFLGYIIENIEGEEGTWVAKGGSKPEILIISELNSSYLFRASYRRIKNFDEKDSNSINRDNIVSRCVVVDEDTVSIEMSIPIFYEKSSFGSYFEEYKGEVREFLDFLAKISINEE